jgi:hypothetical protein
MDGSVNNNGVGVTGSVAMDTDVALGINGRGVFEGAIIASGEIVCSSVGVAGALHAERTSTNIAIAIKLLFILVY